MGDPGPVSDTTVDPSKALWAATSPYGVGKRTEPGFRTKTCNWYRDGTSIQASSRARVRSSTGSRYRGASPAEIELIIVESSSVAEVWGRRE
ncbi:hypothetical protein EV1_005410 [Malus domestica]